MSETGAADPTPAAGGEGPEEMEDHAYFRAVEDCFVRLRGAPLLLSPKDWLTAREWHRRGIPVGLVERTLEELFAQRRERGKEGPISSLRYCASAVEAAWKEARELTAPAARGGGDAVPLDVPARLDALAGALPEGLPGGEELATDVRALAALADDRAVEEALGRLEAEAVERLISGLSPERRAAVDGEVERGLEALADRIPRAEVERARRRLVEQRVRRSFGLPALSLFAPEAEG
jgi:hypothetical protein